ncbi:RNA polymerase sigma-70 factor [Flammeovirga sp. OC4]|uniref:RNA polymerase sigma-70 factor n=1 Tax=Flammeovirga sp. OC4 TaxID=1382345 RepID=UPI0005C647EB|nr:RNA polymerase sigma-70 factor [Flammeovirga sp. OC4]
MKNKLSKSSDIELLKLLLEEKKLSAFDEIYNRYFDRLLRFGYQILNDQQLSEDIIQEIFVTLWTKKETLQITHLNAYLHQAVKFQVAKHFRKVVLTEEQLELAEHIFSQQNTDDLVIVNELNEEVHHLLEELPHRCKEVFHLSRFEHLSNQEIAKRLDISIRTVETHISHALKFLKENISVTSMLLFYFLFL